MTTPDIGEPARLAYAAGIDPIAWAEHEITALIGVHRELVKLNTDMGVEPGGDLSDGAMSRRILGLLMNAGWSVATANDPMEGL